MATIKSRNKPTLTLIVIVIAFTVSFFSCSQKTKAEKIGAEYCNCIKKRVKVESSVIASRFCYHAARQHSPYFNKYVQVINEAKEISNISDEEREEFRIFGMDFWVYINKNCCKEINGPYCQNRDSIPTDSTTVD
jgi:hypothetical protein